MSSGSSLSAFTTRKACQKNVGHRAQPGTTKRDQYGGAESEHNGCETAARCAPSIEKSTTSRRDREHVPLDPRCGRTQSRANRSVHAARIVVEAEVCESRGSPIGTAYMKILPSCFQAADRPRVNYQCSLSRPRPDSTPIDAVDLLSQALTNCAD